MAIHCVVAEQGLGDKVPAGSVLQLNEEAAQALIQAGLAREATEDDLKPTEQTEDEDTEMTDEEDPQDKPDEDKPDVVANAAPEVVTKEEEQAAERIVKKAIQKSNKLHIPTDRHVRGSDFGRTGGFKNMGEAAMCWLRKATGDPSSAKKFMKWGDFADAKVKATGMSFSDSGHVGSDLIPQEWSDELWRLTFKNVPDLLSMCKKYEMKTNVENIPAWVQSSATSGITASVVAETTTASANAIPATVAQTATVQLDLVMGAALVNVSDLLLRFNTYHLQNQIEQTVPQRIRYLTNDQLINGGSGQANLLAAPSTITVVAATAGRINYNDVLAMEAALHPDFEDDAIWLTNKQTLPEIYSIGYPNRGASTVIPAFTAGGFSDMLGAKPKGELLGRPIYMLENVPALGSRGSLILVSMKSIAAGYTSLIAESTPFLFFNLAQNTFRFLFYYDTVDLLTLPYQQKSGGYQSNIIILSAGSTSSS